jgi:hypothetical protein
MLMRRLYVFGSMALLVSTFVGRALAQDGGDGAVMSGKAAVIATDPEGNLRVVSVGAGGSVKASEVSAAPTLSKGQAIREIQRRNAEAVRQQLGASEQEWSILEAKIATIEALRKAIGQPTGPMGNSAADSAGDIPARVRNAAAQLRRGLEDSVSATELKQLMTTYRDTINQAKAALAAARKDLMAIVTSQQEAILLQRGILE